ncbi:MAG TPA: rhodanese-like domain-containing protein [Chloroflexi bacterium]|nr:rhodanese-like domain-containing protein [Chloroflexota bacterium]HHW84648.1 rhodanese-like domain-containing protein [Chloroflexota bacterium]
MRTKLMTPIRYWMLTMLVAGLVFSLGACGGGEQPAASAPVAAAQGGAQASAKINTKITPADYQAQFGAGVDHLLLDVRTPEEFNSGHIPGAVNISVDQLAQRLSEVPQDKPVVLYCRSGNRSNQAAQILDRAGYTQIYDLGGIVTWQQQGYPVE